MNIFIVYISMRTECSITLLTKLSWCVFADVFYYDTCQWRSLSMNYPGAFFNVCVCVFKSQTISYIFYQLIESEACHCIAHVEN